MRIKNNTYKNLYYALIVGEYPSLAKSELLAILESEEIAFRMIMELDQLLIFEAENDAIKYLKHRASMIKELGIVIALSHQDLLELKYVLETSSRSSIINGLNLRIELNSIRGHGRRINYQKLIENVAQAITKLGAKPSPRSPIILSIIASDGILLAGLRIHRRSMKEFFDREPHVRPMYKPGAMKSELCRLFVNLSRASTKKKSLVLDPFCGVGGMLLEACLMGMRGIGIDIDHRSALGAIANIDYYNCSGAIDIIVADASKIPLKVESVDAIATDPPYGRQSIPRGMDLEDLLESFIFSSAEVLKKNSCAAFAIPMGLDSIIEKYIEASGLIINERHMNWVHGSLTRVVYVVCKSC